MCNSQSASTGPSEDDHQNPPISEGRLNRRLGRGTRVAQRSRSPRDALRLRNDAESKRVGFVLCLDYWGSPGLRSNQRHNRHDSSSGTNRSLASYDSKVYSIRYLVRNTAPTTVKIITTRTIRIMNRNTAPDCMITPSHVGEFLRRADTIGLRPLLGLVQRRPRAYPFPRSGMNDSNCAGRDSVSRRKSTGLNCEGRLFRRRLSAVWDLDETVD